MKVPEMLWDFPVFPQITTLSDCPRCQDRRGVTQKMRITKPSTKVIQDELPRRDGRHEQENGLKAAINQL